MKCFTYIHHVIKKCACGYNLRASSPMTQHKCNKVSHDLNSFRYKVAKLCHSHRNNIKEAIFLTKFKYLIKSLDGSKYLCKLCLTMLESNVNKLLRVCMCV